MELTIEQKQTFETEVTPVVQTANELIVKNADQSLSAQGFLKDIKIKRNLIHEKFDPPVRAAHLAWKAAKDLYNFFVNPFDEAETIIKKKVVTFQAEEDRRRQEEARLAEAKRQEEQRKREAELERQAKAAEEKGKTEKAEALREAAANVTVAPSFTPPPMPTKAEGTSFKKSWKGELVDMVALCKAIGEGKASPNMVIANQTAINGHAKANKDGWPIPGLRFFEETEMATRIR